MGTRDLFFWAAEARRKMLTQRIEAFNLALLPMQKPEEIRSQAQRLEAALVDLEHGSRATDLEKENAELIASQRARAAEIIANRKARGGPVKTKRRKKAKGRRITQ